MEVWDAVRVEKILEGGASHPLLIDCELSNPERVIRRQYVLKAMGMPEIFDTNLFNELFGNLLARKLQILTPEPVLIRLSKEFVDIAATSMSNHPSLANRNISLHEGIGVGCKYFPKFKTVLEEVRLSEMELMSALRIYVYDMLVQNPDRTFKNGGKPNCSQIGNDLVAYDFEKCFSFASLILYNVPSWEVTKHGIYPNHIFYIRLKEAMKSGKVDLEPIMSDLRELNITELMKVKDKLPEKWRFYVPKIESHLNDVIKNLSDFEMELYRSLA